MRSDKKKIFEKNFFFSEFLVTADLARENQSKT